MKDKELKLEDVKTPHTHESEECEHGKAVGVYSTVWKGLFIMNR